MRSTQIYVDMRLSHIPIESSSLVRSGKGDEIELGETVEALSSAHDSSFTTDPEAEAVPPPDVSFRSIRDLVLSLDKCLQSNTAAWMAGLARVTSLTRTHGRPYLFNRVVVATPLYVEFVAPPSP